MTGLLKLAPVVRELADAVEALHARLLLIATTMDMPGDVFAKLPEVKLARRVLEKIGRGDAPATAVDTPALTAEYFLARMLIPPRPRRWRNGQLAFNRLQEVNPVLAELVRGGPSDPFYINNRLPAFAEFVRQEWDATLALCAPRDPAEAPDA